MKKLFKKIVYLLLVLFVLANVLCAIQAYHFTRFVDDPETQPFHEMGIVEKTGALLFGLPVAKSTAVDSLTIPHQSLTLVTKDNMKLACWKIEYPQKEPVGAKGTVLMFHGDGSSRSGLIREATAFYNLGWNVFMVDFRAHGESEGSECTVGVNEAKDIRAAYDHVARDGEKNIVLYGISMGASTITKAMYDYPSITPSKLILEMPFASMHDAVEGFVRNMHLPDEPLGTLLTFWGGTELGIWGFSHKPEKYVTKITCPVLLQWGKKDHRVLQDETDAIFTNLASTQKILVKYEDIGHASLYKNDPEKWMNEVSKFLD